MLRQLTLGRATSCWLLVHHSSLLPGLVSLEHILREDQDLLAVLDDEVTLLDDTLGQVGSNGWLSS